MISYVLLALAYVCGATPTSYVVGKAAYGIDLRTRGSGNLGGTNTFRVLGLKAAVPVIVVDILKGWIPAWYFPQIDGDAPWAWALAYGAAAILGHVFSFWIGFKGGKGIATSGGVFMAVAPIAMLAGLATWLLVAFGTRIVSVASIAAAVVIPAVVYFAPDPGGDLTLWFAVGLAVFVIWAHRSNIARLLRGEENVFGAEEKRATGVVGGDGSGNGMSLEETASEPPPERESGGAA